MSTRALVALHELIADVLAPFVEVVHAPFGITGFVGDCMVVDAVDATLPARSSDLNVGVLALVGVSGAEALRLLPLLASRGPQVILAKLDGLTPTLSEGPMPVVVLGIQAQARWGLVLHLVTERVREQSSPSLSIDTPGSEMAGLNDLFGLAKALGYLTDSLISVEDNHGRILAFSPYSDKADPIRQLSILGREPPAWHLSQLTAMKVYERLRVASAVVELQPKDTFHRRLGTGMRHPVSGEYLGTIWAQETDHPMAVDAKDSLLAGSIYAARLVSQTRLIHAMTTELIQRMLVPATERATDDGFIHQVSIDPPQIFTLIAFEAVDENVDSWLSSSEAAAILTMHSEARRRGAMVAPYGNRLYAILPGIANIVSQSEWARRTAALLGRHHKAAIRAALSSSQSVATVAEAKIEVDRVCEATPYLPDRTVITLDEQRTTVLLSESLAALPRDALLSDFRFQRLLDYDRKNHTALLSTLRIWLAASGSIASSARSMLTHQNTIRARLERVEAVTGYRLGNSEDRLLLTLQVRVAGNPVTSRNDEHQLNP